MRSLVARMLAFVGVALMIIGYMLAAPWGAESIVDAEPMVTGAPIFFAIGIVSILASAVLYELWPARDDDRAS